MEKQWSFNFLVRKINTSSKCSAIKNRRTERKRQIIALTLFTHISNQFFFVCRFFPSFSSFRYKLFPLVRISTFHLHFIICMKSLQKYSLTLFSLLFSFLFFCAIRYFSISSSSIFAITFPKNVRTECIQFDEA